MVLEHGHDVGENLAGREAGVGGDFAAQKIDVFACGQAGGDGMEMRGDFIDDRVVERWPAGIGGYGREGETAGEHGDVVAKKDDGAEEGNRAPPAEEEGGEGGLAKAGVVAAAAHAPGIGLAKSHHQCADVLMVFGEAGGGFEAAALAGDGAARVTFGGVGERGEVQLCDFLLDGRAKEIELRARYGAPSEFIFGKGNRIGHIHARAQERVFEKITIGERRDVRARLIGKHEVVSLQRIWNFSNAEMAKELQSAAPKRPSQGGRGGPDLAPLESDAPAHYRGQGN